MQPWIERFGVRRRRLAARLALHDADEARAVDALDEVDAEEVGDRRHGVDGPHLLRDHGTGEGAARQTHDPGNAKHGLVQEQAVLALAVIAKTFSVIGDRDDERAIETALTLEQRDQPRHARVHIGDFAVVRPRAIRRVEGRRRGVRRVRVVQVDPGEERLIAGLLGDPRAGGVHDRSATALRLELHRRVEAVELRVELVESLREAVLAAENKCADEAARTVSGSLQHLGERGRLFGHRRRRVIADAIPGWIAPVRIAVCAGPVSGDGVVASAKRTPSRARRSSAGVAAPR